LAVAALVSTPVQAAAPDELCMRLRTFETAQLPNAERRWVEFHWGYDQVAIWSWACRHSKDKLAKTTCDWMMHHTNREFTMLLPQRVMACHGYSFPKFASYDWSRMAGTIELRGAADRRVLMDLNFRDLPNGEQAMRVSVEDSNGRYEPDELPPIEPMQSDQKAPPH
jgi:hypothetical protein